MRTINILGGLVLLGIMLVLLFSVSAVLHPISSMEHRTFRAQCPPPPSTPPSSSKMETQEKSKVKEEPSKAEARRKEALMLDLRSDSNDWLRRTHGDRLWAPDATALKDLTRKLPSMWQAYRARLPNPDGVPVVVDVGAARYGQHADQSEMLILQEEFGAERVATFGFDVSSGKAAELRLEAERLKINPRFFRVEEKGILDHTGNATVYAKVAEANKNLYSLVPPGKPLYQIQVTTLEDFVRTDALAREHLGSNPLFYVKVDTEGGELGVLQGMRTLMEKGGVLMASFEYGLMWGDLYHKTTTKRDVYQAIGDVPHPTLRSFQRLLHSIVDRDSGSVGYTLFLAGRDNMVPLSGPYWDSNFEACLEPRRILKHDRWCVLDVVAIRNEPHLLRTVLGLFGVRYNIEKFIETVVDHDQLLNK